MPHIVSRALVLTLMLFLSILPKSALALGGGVFVDEVIKPVGVTAGSCNFNPYYDVGFQEAQVNFSGNGGSSGSNYWFGGNISAWPGDITSASIESTCGISNIQNFVSDGANGTFASDDFMGVRFRGTHGGTVYDYEIGIKGASSTALVNTRVAAPANTAPTADAGTAQNVASGAAVTLDGSGSDAQDAGQTLTYAWSQIGTPAVTLSDATAASPSFTAPTLAAGDADVVLTFSLTVNDGIDNSTASTVTVTVAAPANTAPTADAGTAQNVASGASVTLDGTGSDAQDAGQTLTYAWSQIGTPAVTLSDATAASPSFTAPTLAAGDADVVLTFSLTVNDGIDNSTASTVTVTVAAPANTAPTADAGTAQNVASGASVTLDGTGSDAQDAGQTLTYAWSQIGTPAVTLSDATAASPSFTAPTLAAGDADVVLTFSLTVNDGIDNSTASTVTVTVAAPIDSTNPSVTLSGMPESHDGVSPFSLSVTFSEPVEGFAADDLDVQHGSVTSLSGAGADYTVQITPSAKTSSVVVQVKSNAVTDASGNQNDSSAQVQIAAEIVRVATEEIGNFFVQRGRLLSRAQPKLSAFMGGSRGRFNANGTSTRAHLDFATGLDTRVWANVMGLWSDEDGDTQSYAHLSLGSHVVKTDTMIIGAMAQVDRSEATQTNASIESRGYLVGPYLVGKLPEQPMVFSASVLRGNAQNEITLTGLPTDDFESTRTLTTIGVEGSVAFDSGLVMIPSVDVLYLLDEQHEYVDSADNTVPAQDVTMTQATLGLGFEYPLAFEAVDVLLTSGVNTAFSKTRTAGATDKSTLWGVDVGTVFMLSSGATLSADLFYDGLGETNNETYGGGIVYEVKF
ncbi:PKD domain-containing protein [Yoonia maritima]|uniref:PKD domain-containing protein n=1 Tax=Yoonia maritima TaxID=1435347 RepID=UPI0013A60A09|nr:Ig-like domain-containing protein [Yoonia maritima]